MDITFGMKDKDGNVVQDTVHCALTGQLIEAGDAMVGVAGTPYFVRMKSWAYASMLEEQWQAIKTAVPQEPKQPKGSK